ncbi:MAG: flagellar hook-basal body complex protein [bacterium]|nr:flagellar hook-basal body complex protein [bacterium]
MMRSLYSAVSGLKTHQTKMDVIGNNISNVNTVAFKSSTVTFSSIMYQTLSSASGANESTGTGGVNAKQIGLGVTTGSTTMSITSAGAAETTGNPFDLKITDKSTSSFFVVNNGSENVFTKAGSFYVDGTGNLCMTSTGYTVMGWQVDPTTATIKKDTVSALKIMSAGNQTSAPESTTKARCYGVVDNNNTQVTGPAGYGMNLLVYDNLGYSYTAKFSVQAVDALNGKYAVNLTDIIDSKGKTILNKTIALNELFGPGTAGASQGSNVTITDNFTFATGMSKMDIKTVVDKAATTTPAGGGAATTSYTYYLNARDVNDQLGLTGTSKLPDGYRVRVTSAENTLAKLQDDMKASTTGYDILNEAGAVVGRGKYESGAWKFYTVAQDGSGTETATTTEFQLVKTVTLEDYKSAATVITSDDGQTGYRYTLNDDLIKALGLSASTYKSGDVIYYWPNYKGTDITYTDASGDKLVFQGIVSDDKAITTAGGTSTYTPIAAPSRTYGVEELMEDYSYTTITGETLNANTEGRPVFTTELPKDAEIRYNMFGGNYSIVTPSNDGFTLQFNTIDGTLSSVGGGANLSQTLNLSKLAAAGYDGFSDVTIDFSSLLNYNNGGANTSAMVAGDADNVGKGKKLGALTGLTVDTTGKIYGSYDNGNTVLLGQIAVAQFSNAAGLEATGDNCYKSTLNSGDFDGIGVEISADGSSISTGELEMSNVDLSSEFTSMITTQRGFQANSRVITTSDSMLEELINLKR